jgi:hypothetical protein
VSTEIKVSAALDAALRRAFSDAGVRVAPSATMTEVVSRFNALGISCEMQDGCLVLKQDEREFSTALACKGFAARAENVALFITEKTSTQEWTRTQKSEYIAKHGLDAWENRLNAPQLDPGVRVLDRNMSRKDYLNLTRTERVAFITEFGAGAVSHVMGKKA